ncbi:hypothetical protein JHL21_11315 [Devosia sp. WQ 349]|uniref:MarR family transcriptional regulator n=1 Tax=Devosia sp. WQ 349K1 TaxID=2800329 RepID=UPI001903FAE7|nr:helix-turn-helix domain-containing protein [Devosia sp. WQ 349K1]MBK1795087.1 hypothetical protein [Devosia sp. WQ 349K1]
MEYFEEVLDRKTGKLLSVSQGDWITVTELGESMGLGPKETRSVLAKMQFLQVEGSATHSRYRLPLWAVDEGLGRRIERKGKPPFDVISPLGQSWVAERWEETMAAMAAAKGEPVRIAQAALAAFKQERNAYAATWERPEMTTKEEVYWVVYHFPELTQSEIAQVVHVSQPLVHRLLAEQRKRLIELKERRERVLEVKPKVVTGG